MVGTFAYVLPAFSYASSLRLDLRVRFTRFFVRVVPPFGPSRTLTLSVLFSARRVLGANRLTLRRLREFNKEIYLIEFT